MGIFDAFFNPSKNTDIGYGQARQDFQKTREMTSPFLQDTLGTSRQANSTLADLLGYNGADVQLEMLRNTPGYQFALEQGQNAIDQSALARGNLNSGATLKELQRFGTGLADQTYQSAVANNMNNRNAGFGATSALSNQSNQYGQLAVGQGQARDAGNQGGLANILGLAGTVAGFGSGGGFGNIFGKAATKPYFGFH